MNQGGTGPNGPMTPKWQRELRLLRRDGLRKYVRLALALRRFNRSVRRMERTDGYDY